jgi:hypothetical protein
MPVVRRFQVDEWPDQRIALCHANGALAVRRGWLDCQSGLRLLGRILMATRRDFP